MALHMSIVLIEFSIDMYHTKGAVADLRRLLREERMSGKVERLFK